MTTYIKESTIHLNLRRLIEEKSKRDNINFTACQLAQALGMPRSMITKLTHPDKDKRVINPKIATLVKIVDFFRSDGFSISLENLIGKKSKKIDIRNQSIFTHSHTATIHIYPLDGPINKNLGTIDFTMGINHINAFGLYSTRDIKPFFKAGSLFIIDPDMPLKNESLIAIILPQSEHTEIKKYCIYKHQVLLKSLDETDKDIILMPSSQSKIIGVIIQVNAKT